MKRWSSLSRSVAVAVVGLFCAAAAARAAEIHVVSSGGFAAAYKALAPEFERTTGHHLVTGWGPSMGDTTDAVPARLKRGEAIDVLIMVGDALGDLVKDGKVVAASRVDLARSSIGIAVRAGARHPDIGSVAALRQALLDAPSIAYSDSASGVYVGGELFRRLGIEDAVKPKSRMIPATPVGEIVARGEAALGLQQISELLPVAGIELVGPLPAEVQKVTIFSAGILVGAREPAAGEQLLAFLTSKDAAATVAKTGLEPINPGK